MLVNKNKMLPLDILAMDIKSMLFLIHFMLLTNIRSPVFFLLLTAKSRKYFSINAHQRWQTLYIIFFSLHYIFYVVNFFLLHRNSLSSI